jgi:hypothetical protein
MIPGGDDEIGFRYFKAKGLKNHHRKKARLGKLKFCKVTFPTGKLISTWSQVDPNDVIVSIPVFHKKFTCPKLENQKTAD